ncbi:hypothetical protein N331_11079, partial [Merops nubicus]
PQRNPAQQTRPQAKDKCAPAVPAKAAAAAAPLHPVGSPHGTGRPALPRRKPLPHVKVLGERPEKPRRPPVVDLKKFGVAACHGTRARPAAEPPRSARPGTAQHPHPQGVIQEGTSPQDEDEIYDDVEPVGVPRRGQGLLLPTASRPLAYPC